MSAACELDQGCMYGLDIPTIALRYPKTAQWLKRMTVDDAVNYAAAAKLRRAATKTMAWIGKQKDYPKL